MKWQFAYWGQKRKRRTSRRKRPVPPQKRSQPPAQVIELELVITELEARFRPEVGICCRSIIYLHKQRQGNHGHCYRGLRHNGQFFPARVRYHRGAIIVVARVPSAKGPGRGRSQKSAG